MGVPEFRVETLQIALERRQRGVPEPEILQELLAYALASARGHHDKPPEKADRIGAELLVLAIDDLGWTPPANAVMETTN